MPLKLRGLNGKLFLCSLAEVIKVSNNTQYGLMKNFISHCIHSLACSRIVGVSKELCLQNIQSCSSMDELKKIHSRIFRIGLHHDKAIVNTLLVFCTNPSFGNLHYAEKIFDYTESPWLFIYNLMVKAYAKKGRFKKTILVFSKLREDRLWPDNFTCPFVLKAIGHLEDFKLGKQIHGFVIKCGMELDSYVGNSLIDMYAELGTIQIAQQLFDRMPESDRCVVSWNVMISGFVRCRMFENAISLFQRMRQETNLLPEEATIVSTLAACTATKNLVLGKEIHNLVIDRHYFTPIIVNSLLVMYSKCGYLDIARQIFNEVPTKNVICWTSMISGYVNSGELDEARALFDRSPVKDIVSWTAMINGYVQFNRFDDALGLFQQMQLTKIRPDAHILVSLLTGCAEMGALEQGKWIHRYIEENRIAINTVVATALMEMYAKCGCVNKSVEIFSSLKAKDAASWTSIICSLAMNGKTQQALQFFSEMKQAGIRPDDITFIGVLSACSHGGLVDEAWRHFYSMMDDFHIEPKLEHYGCLVDLLGRAGNLDEAENLIQKIPNEKNDIIVPLFGSLLSSCRLHGNTEVGERMADLLMEIESQDSGVHTLLASIYASANRWSDVTKVREKMKDLGVKKVPGCSSIEIDGVIHEFLISDASHPNMKEVYSMLDRLKRPLLDLDEATTKTDHPVVMNL